MAGFRIVKNELQPYITKTLKKLRNPDEFLIELGKLERAETDLRFKFGEDPQGAPWEPSHRALRENGKTLVDTGNLQRGIDFVVEGRNLYVGTNVKYGKKHQFGENGLPVREFLGVNEQTKENASLVFSKIFDK